jgi:hypothetical protein
MWFRAKINDLVTVQGGPPGWYARSLFDWRRTQFPLPLTRRKEQADGTICERSRDASGVG